MANVYNEPIPSVASPCYGDVKIPLKVSALQAHPSDQMMKPSVQDVMQHRPHSLLQKRAERLSLELSLVCL